MAVPARIISVGGGTVVARIIIDISVPRIEAVIASPGATVAPAQTMRRAMPDRARVLDTHPIAWTEVCRRRGDRHPAASGRCNCRRQYQPLHGHARNLARIYCASNETSRHNISSNERVLANQKDRIG